MSNLTAKFASALLIGVATGPLSMALPAHAAGATDSCLTEPTSDKAQGKHWYYHIERGTGRHCWYLRGEDETSARADEDRQASTEKPASRKSDAEASRSIADAHAEIAPRSRPATDNSNAAAAPSVWPAPPVPNAANNGTTTAAPADTTQAARWPQAGQADATAAAQPETSLMAADAQSDTTADSSVPPPPVAAPPERQTGSIQKLALVVVGALTLAGLTGSAVYRLGRRRRRNDWLRERSAWQTEQNPHLPPWVDEPRLRSDPAVADLDEQILAEQESEFSIAESSHVESRHVEPRFAESPLATREAGAPARREDGEHGEKIEDFLARLTQQLQEELDGPRSHRDARAAS